MIIAGKVIKYSRENINTDEIIPARYLNTSDPDQLASHCMEDLDKDFIEKKNGINAEILITGANMGCGSSREHAPIAIKHAGIKAVVAPSYARIFFRNSINMGLPIFECKEKGFIEEIKEGDKVAINADDGYMENTSTGSKYKIQIIPEFLQDIIKSGGLVPFARKILKN
ncbi:MAG: 3-isopropylmalate dehydratase small subunit [Candidatus Hodarchaeota archaeon]